jgi:bifunctional UDP-N-acetylglucosamine pyrophosphorylase/glucosamine-1-phosphate N-acetyltransferase
MRSAPLSAIVLAAGDGRRMRSTRPKPLHVLCGKTMLHYVSTRCPSASSSASWSWWGTTGEQVEKKLRDQSSVHYIEYVEQARALGTGDAAATALSAFAGDDDLDDPDVLVLPGDTPLLQAATVAALAEDTIGSAPASPF